MRWKDKSEEYGEWKKRFSFVPRLINGAWVWLEFIEVRTCIAQDSYRFSSPYTWREERLIERRIK